MEPKQGTHTLAVKILKLTVYMVTMMIQGLKLGASFEAQHDRTRQVGVAVNAVTKIIEQNTFRIARLKLKS